MTRRGQKCQAKEDWYYVIFSWEDAQLDKGSKFWSIFHCQFLLIREIRYDGNGYDMDIEWSILFNFLIGDQFYRQWRYYMGTHVPITRYEISPLHSYYSVYLNYGSILINYIAFYLACNLKATRVQKKKLKSDNIKFLSALISTDTKVGAFLVEYFFFVIYKLNRL